MFFSPSLGPPEAPAPPMSPRHTSLTSTSFTVQWNEPSTDGGLPIRNYTVEIFEQGNSFCSGSFSWSVVAAGVDPTTFVATVTDLIPDFMYQYRVRAFNYEFSSDWSAVGRVETPSTG